MSLLTIVSDAAAEIGIASPTTVIGNNDPNVTRLLALANREGRELASKYPWTILQREHTFNTADGTAEYALPTDFRAFIADTAWNRADYDRVRGNLTPQEWQTYKSGIIGSGIVHQRWRVKRAASGTTRKFVIDPTPSSIEAMVFEYLSDAWCSSSDGTTLRTTWAADADVGLLSESLMTLGLVWRFKNAIGTEYGLDLLQYEQTVSRALADDLAMPTKMLHTSGTFKLGGYVPDTGFGA